MTNHVTSIFLIPPAILTVLLTHHASRITNLFKPSYLLKLIAAFLAPLLLYAYLPLRWQAVNNEPMGLARFVDWVVAGRFQGALQLRAWLDDTTRYEIIWRLFLDNWGWFNLALALLGFILLIIKNWRVALVLFSLWFGYTFYTLNYYVPDLAVFVIPAQIMVGIFWAIAVAEIGDWRLEIPKATNLQYFGLAQYKSLISTLIIIPTLLLAVNNWTINDQSSNDGLESWGRAVLNLPLAENGTILADGEKIAPLNYLQVAEGLRPDLDISVWPDEAAYRGQVDGRIADGQTVYLARQLPNLQSIYHLRAVGPLTEVSTQPLTALPETATPMDLTFDSIKLLGYELEPIAHADKTATAITFYWQSEESINEVLHVYTQLEGFGSENGRHPANNFYPTNAWKENEIVSDYHLIPRPLVTHSTPITYQVALAPPFTPADQLNWQSIISVWALEDTHQLANSASQLRMQVGELLFDGITFPQQSRPQSELPIQISGFGEEAIWLNISLQPMTNTQLSEYKLEYFVPPLNPHKPHIWQNQVDALLPTGQYHIVATYLQTSGCGLIGGSGDRCAIPASYCGWMQLATESCTLGEVEISGVGLPETAVNFEDKIALLNVDIPNPELQAGGQLQLTLNWLALADMAEDYTITVQVLDTNDRLVGQTDSWPVQGTRPTSQWQAGETIADPYTLYLDGDLPAGDYRLLVGIYLLGNGRRLPVVNDEGLQMDDKVIETGLFVP